MEPIPLIPKAKEKGNHDVSCILREAFQDFLVKEILPSNVSYNLQKYRTDNALLKSTAVNAHHDLIKQQGRTLDYANTEEKLMYNKGHQLICETFINENAILKEKTKLNSIHVLPNVDTRDAFHYGLISTKELEFNLAEIAIDARLQIINQKQFPCEEKLQIETETQKEIKLPEIIDANEKFTPDDPLVTDVRFSGFKLKPEKIIFYSYELATTYKKKLIVQNITTKTKELEICKEPNKYFILNRTSSTSKVPAGLSEVVIIEFRTDTYLDVIDFVQFETNDGIIFEVKLIAYRNAPNLRINVQNQLKNKECNIQVFPQQYDITRAIALNNTIDCGFCFLGSSINISLFMYNEGGVGDFFIMTEDEWYDKNIQNVNRNMVLSVGPFTVYPCYFKANEDEYNELKIRFSPDKYGLHLETLFVLCNNNSLEKIEIIGDGVIFEKTFVEVQLPVKSQNICAVENEITHHFDCGIFLPHHKQTKMITINNNSCIDLTYEIILKPSKSSQKCRNECKINQEWISVTRSCMPCYTEFDIKVDICCKTYEPGAYTGILMLKVKNIPKASLRTGTCFDLSANSNDDALVDIVIAKIEVLCVVEPYKIQINPNPYDFPTKLKYGEAIKDIIQIRSFNKIPLRCEWLMKNDAIFATNPTTFTLTPGIDLEWRINIADLEYNDLKQEITLNVEDGLYKDTLLINVFSEKPQCVLSNFIINLGNVTIKSNIKKELYVENISHATINWLIIEIAYDIENKRFKEVRDRIEPYFGQLNEFGDKTKLSYDIVTDKTVLWSSILILITQYKLNVEVSGVCCVNYKVLLPRIKITTEMSRYPILFCNQILHTNFTTMHKLCVSNVGNITASYCWGTPIGSQKDNVHITFKPNSAIIQPGTCIVTDVELTPMVIGVSEYIFVPCYVECLDEPIMLRVLCLVDYIYFNIILPNVNDDYDVVFWPPMMVKDNFEDDLSLGIIDTVTEEENIEKIPSAYRLIQSKSHTYLLDSKSISNSCSCDSTTEYSCPNAKKTLLSKFIDTNLLLQDHFIQFESVPLKTPVKKSIFIENLTPLKGIIKVQVTNFYGVDVPQEQEILSKVLFNAKQKRTNEFDDMMNDHGFLIAPKPDNIIMNPKEKIKIDIYVYANTWGVYCDEILIEVNECLPFVFNVVAKCIGMPIEFPFALNTINSEPIFRFDTVLSNSINAKRHVKVKNISAIPLTVMWHVFLKEEDSPEFPTHDYFNVIFDMHDPHKDCCFSLFEIIDGQLLLTEDFYGWTDNKIFTTSFSEMSLKPYAIKSLDIEFNPKAVDLEVSKTVIAYLVGTVFISNCYKHQAYLYRRTFGEDLNLVRLKLTANLEMPILKYTSGECHFTVYACEIVKHVPQLETTLTFKNCSNCGMQVSFFIKYPFEITKMYTTHKEFAENHILNQNDVLRLKLKAKICVDEVFDMSSMFYKKDCQEEFYGVKNEKNMSVTIKKDLIIQQNSAKETKIPITLTIYFPKFEVDVKTINFDQIFVGTIVKTNFLIKNRSAQDIPFKISISSEGFIIEPNCGLLKKSTGTLPEYVMVVVAFKPMYLSLLLNNPDMTNHSYSSLPNAYNDTIKISTNIPNLYFNIPIYGSGTWNENYYK